MNAMSRAWPAAVLAAVVSLFPTAGARADDVHPLLQAGFRAMHGLDFASSEAAFAEYERLRPDDPLGYAAHAAEVLFREFDRLRVLDAEFYVDDKKLFGEHDLSPDPAVRLQLFVLAERAKDLAAAVLHQDSGNEQALFASALAHGLMADYKALVERKYWAAAKLGRAGLKDATELLDVNPEFYDAYIWPGVTNYVVGSLPFPLRWLAKLRGFPGDKMRGIDHLELVAEKGTLLKPYAKTLLVVARLRAKDRAAARALLADLSSEFPTNPLFEKHARRLEAP